MDDLAHNKADWYNLVTHDNTLYCTYLLTECGSNTYGPSCTKSCGHCVNGEQCHHIKGACRNGCKAGYYSTMCEKGKHNNTTYTVVS